MKEGLKLFTDIHLTTWGLLIFFGWFLFLLYRVFRQIPREHFYEMAQLPMKDEE